MCVLIDYSQIAHASIHAFSKDIEKSSPSELEGLIRHIVINSILTIRNKFPKQKYGQIIICLDDRNYWRRDIFSYYKANRKKIREESKLDWDEIFKTLNKITDEIIQHFHYKVLKVPKCEADDIIGVLSDYFATNETTTVGFEEVPQKVIAVSEDQDFVQCMANPNFSLYLPRKKKFHEQLSDKALNEYIIEHIVKGDKGDNIPNILSHDNIFM